MIGAVVRSRGQKDLRDDGKREWDKEIKNCLDHEYQDWENPQTTYMIPENLQRAGSKGEKAEVQVFNLLKAFGEERNEPMFVVHSYKFKERVSQLNVNFKLSITSKIGNWVNMILLSSTVTVVLFSYKSRLQIKLLRHLGRYSCK